MRKTKPRHEERSSIAFIKPPKEGIYFDWSKRFTKGLFWISLSVMSLSTQTKTPDAFASPLLEKIRRLGLSLPLDLERLAVMRGCDYYARDLGQRLPPLGEVPLSKSELAIALIAPSLHPGAREIRLTAALLGAPGVPADELAALAVQENCEDVVRHIAICGSRYEPDNNFWQSLLTLLPKVRIDTDRLPHPTRFVEMTGIDRGKVGISTRWIRPRQQISA